jgi:hypothetical protein
VFGQAIYIASVGTNLVEGRCQNLMMQPQIQPRWQPTVTDKSLRSPSCVKDDTEPADAFTVFNDPATTFATATYRWW